MPTLLATILSSCGSFLVGKLIEPLWLSIPVSTVVWLIIYIYMRKLLRDMRP
jgi:hypothetical protein